MKTLQLGSIAFVLVSLFSACTKDTSISSDSSLSAAAAPAPTLGGGKNSGSSNNVNPSVDPVLTPTQSPGPVKVGSPVTVSYVATHPTTNAPVDCGEITIYRWNASTGNWDKVATHSSAAASYTFTPVTAQDCAYTFKAKFKPNNRPGANDCSMYKPANSSQTNFCVDVEDCVSTFTIGHNVTAQDIGNGLYEFTVTYTLTSPVAVTGVKFQGGATSGGQFNHVLTDAGEFVVKANNQNSVLTWNGDLSACTSKTLTFKYKRNFSCPATGASVTGNWKASAGDTVLGEIAPLTYSCN